MSDPVRLGPCLDIVAEEILRRVLGLGGAAHLESSSDSTFATVVVTEIPQGYEVRTAGERRPKSPHDIPW